VTALARQPASQLARRRRLAGALQPEQQDHARRRVAGRQSALGVSEERQHLVADDLDDLLTRRQAFQNRLVARLIPDAIDERLDDLEVDVGLEQRQANLAQRLFKDLGGEPQLAAKRLEDVLEAGAE
jgi:hypothetical protein